MNKLDSFVSKTLKTDQKLHKTNSIEQQSAIDKSF